MSAESPKNGLAAAKEALAEKRVKSYEVGGHKFEFVEMSPDIPSPISLLHLPGFGSDGGEYAECMHYAMGRKYRTLGLEEYGGTFNKEILAEALEKAIQSRPTPHTVLHGNSFGAGMVYDLISDTAFREFLRKNNVIGAILETPVLDRGHLRTRLSVVANPLLVRGAVRMNKLRDLSDSVRPSQGRRKVSEDDARAIIEEALREKTKDRKIEVPVHVIFSRNENLSNNDKIVSTLTQQAKASTFNTVESSDNSSGHHVGNYEEMWEAEKKAIEGFVIDASKPAARPEV